MIRPLIVNKGLRLRKSPYLLTNFVVAFLTRPCNNNLTELLNPIAKRNMKMTQLNAGLEITIAAIDKKDASRIESITRTDSKIMASLIAKEYESFGYRVQIKEVS